MISVSYRKARVTTEIFRFGETDKIRCELLLEPVNYIDYIGKIFHMTFLGGDFLNIQKILKQYAYPTIWMTYTSYSHLHVNSPELSNLRTVASLSNPLSSNLDEWRSLLTNDNLNDGTSFVQWFSCSSYVAVTEAQSEATFSTTRTTISTRFKFQGYRESVTYLAFKLRGTPRILYVSKAKVRWRKKGETY